MQSTDVRATVIVPLWNHREFIERQLASLIAQWRPDLELLVIDDGSTDDGLLVAQRCLADHPHVRATLTRNQRTWGGSLPNIALKYASGDIIIEADSDDIALPGRIESILRCFEIDPSCHLVTSNALKISSDDLALGILDTISPDEIFSDPAQSASISYEPRWLGATAAFRRAVFEAFPPIDERICGPHLDLLTPFRAVLLGTHHYLSRPLVGWRQHSTNAHRLAGALDDGGARAERYKFVELTVLAQRLRDLDVLQQAGRDPERLRHVREACHRFFLERFSDLSRLRFDLDRMNVPVQTARPSHYVSAIAPVATLCPGVAVEFAAGTPGGNILSVSPGFNAPEVWGAWTERHAILNVRLGSADILALDLKILRLQFIDVQNVTITALGIGSYDFELHEEIEILSVDVSRRGATASIITLVISTPSAYKPSVAVASQDVRTLGVGLLSIEARVGASA